MEMAIPSSLTLRTIPPLDSPHATYIKVLGRTRGCERRSWICVCPGNCGVEVLTISSLEGRACARLNGDIYYGRGGGPVRRLEKGAIRPWAEHKLTRMLIITLFESDILSGLPPNRANKSSPTAR